MSDLTETITSETNENFYQFDLIKERFEKWNTQFNETYRSAYISLSLPKVFSPLVRCDIIDWNPLEKSGGPELSLENFKWFKTLLTYNQEEMIKSLNKKESEVSFDDFLIIPHIVEKTVLVRLIDIAENFYDPLSTSQTAKFTQIVSKLIYDYSTVNHKSSNTKQLIEAIVSRFKKCFDQDVYIPLYPKSIIDKKNSESSIFFHRQFWQCVKVSFSRN